jgi:predicted RNA-binding Zn-ribbon protein involved in translation (DUF1610 family)
VGEHKEVRMKGDVRETDERGDERVGEALRLDGNAAAELLSEIFVPDLTAVRATCAYCGAIRALGALLVYAHRMGPVIRCPACGAVVLRVARIRNQIWLDPTGARLVVMPEAPAPSGA